jgi:nucleoside-diphosphate-sugar epimerase
MRKLIVGCGYLGRPVARRWLAEGHQVWAVTRSPEQAAELRDAGIEPVLADVTRPETLADLPEVQNVLYAVGYDRAAGLSRWEVYVGGLESFLARVSPRIERLVYISSTGVYGQTDGSWLDESSPCRPQREAGRAFLAAEQRLAAHALAGRSVVLRMAGLYGPGRVIRRSIAAEGFLNLIHVDDMAEVVLAAEKCPAPGLYLASDGHPPARAEYYDYLATLLPSPDASGPPPDRARANKRISNRRLLAELGVKLRYPSYREGLPAALQDVSPPDRDERSGGRS